jgi:hypothetical protein
MAANSAGVENGTAFAAGAAAAAAGLGVATEDDDDIQTSDNREPIVSAAADSWLMGALSGVTEVIQENKKMVERRIGI